MNSWRGSSACSLHRSLTQGGPTKTTALSSTAVLQKLHRFAGVGFPTMTACSTSPARDPTEVVQVPAFRTRGFHTVPSVVPTVLAQLPRPGRNDGRARPLHR